jgi:hypothetical protein
LLSVVNRADEAEDRVVARVRVHLHCSHPKVGVVATRRIHLDERWTLGRVDGRWAVLSISGDPLAGPVLSTPLVPDPSFDTERLREASLAELAGPRKVGEDGALNDLVSADESPTLALADLSVLDQRFDPSLVAAFIAHSLEAWEEATTGSDAPLAKLATPNATNALLRPRLGTRLIIRDPVLKSWEPTKLDLAHKPVAIEVAVEVEAVRFVTNDDGRHLAGNDADPGPVNLRWLLQLTDSGQNPWMLAGSNNPGEDIQGWS